MPRVPIVFEGPVGESFSEYILTRVGLVLQKFGEKFGHVAVVAR